MSWLHPFFSALIGTLLAVSATRADDWPQWRGPTRDGHWRETGVVEKFARAELTPVWVAPIGPGFSGPTVAGDRVFITDRVTLPTEQERVRCFDRRTGRSLWTHAYPCVYRDVDYALGPRAAVTIADGRAFVLGMMGHAHALDVTDGRVLWSRDLPKDLGATVNVWGMSCAPLVVGNIVVFEIGGEPGACLVGLDTRTGHERWRALDGGASYSPPRLLRAAGRESVLAWTARWLSAIDPATGAVQWKVPYPFSRMVHNVADPVVDEAGGHVLLSSFYDGTLDFALSTDGAPPELRWQRSGPNERKGTGLHGMATTPFIREGHVYGLHSYGEVRCLDLEDGRQIWEFTALQPAGRWATAHFVQNGDRTWITTERGEVIIARFTPRGYEEISRAKFLTPDSSIVGREEPVAWAHPAYAHRALFARSDSQLVCIPLAALAPAP